jgi:acyl dehydratase
MSEDSILTPDIKAMLGQETNLPALEPIDKTTIIRYVQATSDSNPLYTDEEYAKGTAYGGIIAPPNFIFDVIPTGTEIGDDGRDLTRIALPGFRVARGGNEYQFLEPARPGDMITRKRKIVDVFERDSKKVGKIIFIVYDTTYSNQDARVLGINRETLLFFK